MRNLAVLAARLAGRPLLMRDEASVLSYARLAGVEAEPERRSGWAGLLGRGRKVAASIEDGEPMAAPVAWLPDWMGDCDAQGYGWSMKAGVAVIRVDGPLLAEGFGYGDHWYHGYDTLRDSVEDAQTAGARAIAVRINSPGGVCASGLPELSDYIRTIRSAAGGIPIWAICEGAYSAAYWLASACDVIVCMKEGGAGSIGAVVTHCDMSGMLSKDGIVMTHVQFGPHKTDFSSLKPLSEDAQKRLQAEIDQWGRWFVAAVHAGRPTLAPEVILATGARCYFGDSDVAELSALKTGLVDRVMTEREAFAALETLVATSTPPAAPAASAPLKEKHMKRSTLAAVLDDPKLSADQKVGRLNAIRADEGDDAPEDDVEDGEKDDPAEAEAGDDDGEDDKIDAKVAKSILASPHAKGRENLAQNLAFEPGMTLEKAETLLKSAGKGGGLASRMEGRDPAVTPGGGKPSGSAPVLDSSAIYAKRAAAQRKRR